MNLDWKYILDQKLREKSDSQDIILKFNQIVVLNSLPESNPKPEGQNPKPETRKRKLIENPTRPEPEGSNPTRPETRESPTRSSPRLENGRILNLILHETKIQIF